jgi:hypothetical protein
MNKIIFLVEEPPEGGFMAKALEASIYSEADTLTTCIAKSTMLLIVILSQRIIQK